MMRSVLMGRSVICLAAMPPGALDLAEIESVAGVGRPTTQVTNPQLALAEYERFQVIVTPDGRAQCEFKPNASRDTCRRVTAELLRQAAPYGVRAVGFNGVARMETDPGEQPLAGFLRTDAITELLGTEPDQSGVKFVYTALDDRARLTVDISPAEDEPLVWLLLLNRHYAGTPDDDVSRNGISWLAALSDELPALVRRLPQAVNASD